MRVIRRDPELEALVDELHALEELKAQLARKRNNRIIELQPTGFTIQDLARLSNVSEGRVNQIIAAGLGALPGSYGGKSLLGHFDADGYFIGGITLDEDGNLEQVQ